jgi:hypothetical protein
LPGQPLNLAQIFTKATCSPPTYVLKLTNPSTKFIEESASEITNGSEPSLKLSQIASSKVALFCQSTI